MVTGRRDDNAVRCLKTPFTRAFAKREKEGASKEELAELGRGSLRKAAVDGNYEEGSFMAGQSAGMVSRRQPAADIVDDLLSGAETVLSEAMKWVR